MTENTVDNFELDLDAVEEAPQPKEKKAKKEKAKKEPAVPDGNITPAQLAEELGMTGRDLRVVLRQMFPDHNKGERWNWAPDSEILAQIRNFVKAKKEAIDAKKAEPKAEKPKKAKKEKADVVESDTEESLDIIIE